MMTTTTPQIKSYCQAVEKGKLNLHVIPNGRGWVVKPLLDEKGEIFSSEKEAIDYAQQMAKERKVYFFVHSEDGRIEQRLS